jgi:hypothetical protein
LRALPGNEFWADDLSIFDAQRINRARLKHSSQVTDS